MLHRLDLVAAAVFGAAATIYLWINDVLEMTGSAIRWPFCLVIRGLPAGFARIISHFKQGRVRMPKVAESNKKCYR